MTDDREMEAWVEKLDKTNPAMAGKIRQLLDEIYRLRDELAKRPPVVREAPSTRSEPAPVQQLSAAEVQEIKGLVELEEKRAVPGNMDALAVRAERQVLAYMLQGPEFRAAVERSGAILRFTSLILREFAERLLSGAVALSLGGDPLANAWAEYDGTADPRVALSGLKDAREREAIMRELWDIQMGGVLLPTVEKSLAKYCARADQRLATESAQRRRVARLLRV